MKWRFLLTNKWASTPHRQRVYTSAIINYLARHDLVMTLSWPWSLTSDHENLFSDVHSHNEYLYQVSLKSFNSVKRYRDTQNRRTGTTDGRTDGRTDGQTENIMSPPSVVVGGMKLLVFGHTGILDLKTW